MRVLVVGATGNVGSRLLPALLSRSHTVVAYVRTASKIPAAVTSHLTAVVEGSGTDVASIKSAILSHNCDAVVNCAGMAAPTYFQQPSQLPDIFAAVAKAASEAHKERGGPVIRCWFMSGWGMLDVPGTEGKAKLVDYVPIFTEHRITFATAQTYSPTDDMAWSLLCANYLQPRHTPPAYPHPTESSASNLAAAADAPLAWSPMLKDIPLVGSFLNIMINVGSYGTPMEDSADFIAADLEKGLQSEWIGKRVGLKVKPKAA